MPPVIPVDIVSLVSPMTDPPFDRPQDDGPPPPYVKPVMRFGYRLIAFSCLSAFLWWLLYWALFR